MAKDYDYLLIVRILQLRYLWLVAFDLNKSREIFSELKGLLYLIKRLNHTDKRSIRMTLLRQICFSENIDQQCD